MYSNNKLLIRSKLLSRRHEIEFSLIGLLFISEIADFLLVQYN